MSYEGFTQYVGVCGHKWDVDARVLSYGTNAEKQASITCAVCGGRAKFFSNVNVTNGYDQPSDPTSREAPVRELGFTDSWHLDHYQNRYATKHPTFQPVGDRWHAVKVQTRTRPQRVSIAAGKANGKTWCNPNVQKHEQPGA